MGRNPKNKFSEVSLAFKEGVTIREYFVEMPFVYKLRFLPANENSGYYEREFFVKPPANVIMLIDEIEKQGYKVTHVEQAVRRFTDLCPRCSKQGVPKIEKKNASDWRIGSARDSGVQDLTIEENRLEIKERPPEIWLTYTHSRSKKCRIRQYQNIPDPAYKQNKIPIEKYFFPHILENMKNGSIWYADQLQ